MLTTIVVDEPSCDYSANLLNKSSCKNEIKRCLYDLLNLIVPVICIVGIISSIIYGILYIGNHL